MAPDTSRQIADEVVDRYGRQSLAEEANITVGDSPNTLFQLLQLGMLVSVRVEPHVAAEAFLRFRERGWTTAKHLSDSGDDERVEDLRRLGYPETDAERVSRMMGDAAAHLLDEYGAKLGDLRDAAGRAPDAIRKEMLRWVEVDDDVVDAFFRDVQQLWHELMPFADKKALDGARRLGLAEDPDELRQLTDDDAGYVRLVDSLVRIRHDGNYEDVRERASAR